MAQVKTPRSELSSPSPAGRYTLVTPSPSKPNRVGTLRGMVSPAPSCPKRLSPQQYIAPLLIRAHVWLGPPTTYAVQTPSPSQVEDRSSQSWQPQTSTAKARA